MAYATVEQLAAALRVQVTPKNSAQLAAALDAASAEIDHDVGRSVLDPIASDDPIANAVCISRGVEWWKATDAAFGALGFDGTGVLAAPRDSFARHSTTLIPLKRGETSFGIA